MSTKAASTRAERCKKILDKEVTWAYVIYGAEMSVCVASAFTVIGPWGCVALASLQLYANMDIAYANYDNCMN